VVSEISQKQKDKYCMSHSYVEADLMEVGNRLSTRDWEVGEDIGERIDNNYQDAVG
jgi:hypothetical protein